LQQKPEFWSCEPLFLFPHESTIWVSSSLAKNTSAVDLTKAKQQQFPQKMQKENQWCNV
jgi:hypothetical protein